MPRKIAIVMGAENWKDAPFADPTWDIWSLSWHVPVLPRCDLAFEMHRRDQWHLTAYPDQDKPPEPEGFVPFLRALTIPLICHEKHDDISTSVRFPKEEIMSILGWDRPNFASTISYTLAYAVWKLVRGVEISEVGLWGVSLMAAGEWAYQRPNANRLAGFLEGRGVKIYTPPECMLLGIPFEYGLGVEEEFDDQANAMMIESFARYNDALVKGLTHLHRQEQIKREALRVRANGGG